MQKSDSEGEPRVSGSGAPPVSHNSYYIYFLPLSSSLENFKEEERRRYYH